MGKTNLLTRSNPKTTKGEQHGHLTAVLHLSPAMTSGAPVNVCPHASSGCLTACLNTAGRGGVFKTGETTNAIQEARKRKTRSLFENQSDFGARLDREIKNIVVHSAKHGLKPAIRLNGTSDIAWEHATSDPIGSNPDVQFYDYTKSVERATSWDLPLNYDLTFSRTESNWDDCVRVLDNGGRVAVVFSVGSSDEFPLTYRGYPVVDGDEHDLTFLRPSGSIIALKAKGRAKQDDTGFVVREW